MNVQNSKKVVKLLTWGVTTSQYKSMKVMLMIKISHLINSSILNSEWVGFSGDSEFVDSDGELQLGYWNFIGITDETKGETPFELEDEISEEAVYGDYTVLIRNKKNHICMVQFKYVKEDL